MTIKLNKNLIERFSRQIVLKDIGIIGQKKIMSSKVLIIGAGGLGCPAAEFLTRAGIGALGIVDYDKVCLSNIHRQTLYDSSNIGMLKVRVLQSKLKKINPKTKVKIYQFKLDKNRLNKIYAKHTKKNEAEIKKALERDNFMTAIEAKEFGLIDEVVEKRI